jgi:DNA-binding GntR family transcriptional regulator
MRGSSGGLLEELIATFERVDAPPSTIQAEVYDRICAALMEGRLRPGQAISIRNLAAAMNTSPMPVREALRRLEAIHVIKQQPGRAITVAELSVPELQEIRDIRVLLEGFAAKLATKVIAPRGIDRLARIADDMHRQWETTTDIGRMLRANREFHFGIYQAAKRPVLVSMIKSLWLRVAPFFYEICRDNGHVDFSIEQHLRAVDALRKRDPEGVAKAIAADIGVAADRLVGHALDREGTSTSPKLSAQSSQKAY